MNINDILEATELSDSLKIQMITIFAKGGKSKRKPSFEEWVKDVNPDYIGDNYDLKAAYEYYPFEKMEKWKKAVNSDDPDYYMNYQDENGDYPYHLGSVAELPNGDYIFLKKGKEEDNPELHFETDSYRDGSNKISKTHDLVFDEKDNRYYYRKKLQLLKHKEGGSVKELKPTEAIQIGDKEYDVEVADTSEKRSDGLSRVQRLKSDEGMLFVYNEDSRDYYTMKDTSIDLDIIFIDSEGKVIEVNHCKAFGKDPIVCETPFRFVLETNINSGIEVGDELDLEDDEISDDDKETIKHSKMLVLDSNGDVQMKLHGGERIVSMIKTRLLIKNALKAYHTDNDTDYRRVGRIILKEFDALDSREPQYTSK